MPDGNVLVENIFMSEKIMPQAIGNPTKWTGISPDTKLTNAYARSCGRCLAAAGELPACLLEYSYQLAAGALMFAAGANLRWWPWLPDVNFHASTVKASWLSPQCQLPAV